jgi:hypothetical protein
MIGTDAVKQAAVTSPIVRKILGTLVPSGVTYLITVLFQQGQIWAITLATFIGGVSLVVQFLMDFDNRLHAVEIEHSGRVHALQEAQRRHATEVEFLVHQGYSKVNDATKLFSLVESSALPTGVVTQFVQHSTQIGQKPDLIFDFAHAEISRMSEFLREVATGGDVTYDGEDREWLLGLTRHARSSINATSLTTVDGGGSGFADGLWASDLGHRYLEGQRDAVQRGVTVRRVFVLDRRELAEDSGLQQVCRTHRELGIDIRILDPSAMPAVGRGRLFDFTLFDDVVSYEVSTASRLEDTMSPVYVSTRLVLGEQRLRERMQRFRDLWAAAHDFKD